MSSSGTTGMEAAVMQRRGAENVLSARLEGSRRKGFKPHYKHNVAAPLERLTIDILGPLSETDQGNRYFLVVMNYFSKWVEALAMPEQSAVTVAHLLVTEVTSRFSVSLKFTLTKDVTSNQCCSRKFVGF